MYAAAAFDDSRETALAFLSVAETLTVMLWRLLHVPAALLGVFPIANCFAAPSPRRTRRPTCSRPRPWPAALAYTAAALSLVLQSAYAVASSFVSSGIAEYSSFALYLAGPALGVCGRARRRRSVCHALTHGRLYWSKYPLSHQGWPLVLAATAVGVAMMLLICLGDTLWLRGQPDQSDIPDVALYPNLVYTSLEFTLIVCPAALLASLGADLRHQALALVTASSIVALRSESRLKAEMELHWREVCVRQQFLHDLYVRLNSIQGVNVVVFLVTNSLDMTWSISDAVKFYNHKTVRRASSYGCIVSATARCLAFVFLCWVLARRDREFSALQSDVELLGISLQLSNTRLESVGILRKTIDQQDARLDVLGLFYLTSVTAKSMAHKRPTDATVTSGPVWGPPKDLYQILGSVMTYIAVFLQWPAD